MIDAGFLPAHSPARRPPAIVPSQLSARPLQAPSVWTGAELAADPSWTFPLGDQDIAEIEQACARVRARGLRAPDFGRRGFPQPERRRKLPRMWINLHHGRPLASEFADRLNTGPRGGVAVSGVDYPRLCLAAALYMLEDRIGWQEWRGAAPRLEAWYRRVSGRPSFRATRVPE